MRNVTTYDADGNSITCLVQWDKNVYIYIDEPDIKKNYHVDFYNDTSDKSYMVETEYTDKLKIKVPNQLLTMPHAIKGYIIVPKSDGIKSYYGFIINVKKRPKPSDYVYVDDDNYLRLEAVLEQCLEAAKRAEAAAKAAENSSSSSGGSGGASGSVASHKHPGTDITSAVNEAKHATKADTATGLSVTVLDANVDWNTVTSAGVYYMANAPTGANKPCNIGGMLHVDATAGGSIYQDYTVASPPQVWKRRRNGGNWNAWTLIGPSAQSTSNVTPNNATFLRTGDLNDYHGTDKVGFYYAAGDSKITNNPSTLPSFGLLVLRIANTYFAQLLVDQAGVEYRRFWNASKWSDWWQVYDSGHKQT